MVNKYLVGGERLTRGQWLTLAASTTDSLLEFADDLDTDDGKYRIVLELKIRKNREMEVTK